jgi:hypothetical protein
MITDEQAAVISEIYSKTFNSLYSEAIRAARTIEACTAIPAEISKVAMKAALEAYEQSKWQPIESAPKDGTMILICLPRMMNLIVRARYCTVRKQWLHDYEGEGGIKQYHCYHKGDLWRPMPVLPTPPNKKAPPV